MEARTELMKEDLILQSVIKSRMGRCRHPTSRQENRKSPKKLLCDKNCLAQNLKVTWPHTAAEQKENEAAG